MKISLKTTSSNEDHFWVTHFLFPTSQECFSFYPVSSRIQVSKPTEDDTGDVTTDNAGEASEHEASKHSGTLLEIRRGPWKGFAKPTTNRCWKKDFYTHK